MRILSYIIKNYKKPYVFPFWLLLFFFSLIYRQVIQHQRKRGYTNSFPGIFILSVGNLTTGGTGKTEVVRFLSQAFSRRIKTAVVLRGYKARPGADAVLVSRHSRPEEVGDEALIHGQKSSSLVIVARKKSQGVRLAQKKGCRMVILDDAFQHWKVARNLDLVLIDATHAFGNHHLLPAGILREPVSSLSHADCILITKCLKKPEKENGLVRQIRKHNPRAPVFASCYVLDHVSWKNRKVPLAKMIKKKILLFAGLGNTGYFIHLVRKYLKPRGLKLLSYPDHYSYQTRDVAYIRKILDSGYDLCLTTEKDYVKLKRLSFEPHVFYIKLDMMGPV